MYEGLTHAPADECCACAPEAYAAWAARHQDSTQFSGDSDVSDVSDESDESDELDQLDRLINEHFCKI